ncbi:MAG: hypothetical protein ABJA80_03480 [bacterium]
MALTSRNPGQPFPFHVAHAQPGFVDVSAGAWTPLFEELLQGLVHAMNNRITSLSAFAELAAMDGEPIEARLLRNEVARLHAASAQVGLLAHRNPEAEALELAPQITTALGIHAHHPRMRSVECTLEQQGNPLPVRVPRWAILRLLLLLIDAAKRAGDEAGGEAVPIQLSGDDVAVRVAVRTPGSPDDDILALATTCGGTLTATHGHWVLELPSLLEVRREERQVR